MKEKAGRPPPAGRGWGGARVSRAAAAGGGAPPCVTAE